MRGKPYIDGYAIVRVDGPCDPSHPEDCYYAVTVIRVVGDEEAATKEAERLNAVNKDKACCYFASFTRVDPKVCGQRQESE